MSRDLEDLEAHIKGCLALISAIKASRPGPPRLSDARIEREAGVPQGFLNKTRKGKNRDAAGMASIEKLFVWAEKNKVKAPGRAKEARSPLETPRNPMKGLIAAFEPEERTTDPAFLSLSQEIEAGKSAKALGAILRRLSAGVASGLYKDLEMVETLERLTVRQAKLVKEAREEKANRQVRALEILTPAEQELLRKHREELAGPPLKPGEAVEPPPELPPDPEDAAP